MAGPKKYDRSYFDRWYRKSRIGVGSAEFIARKVRLAVSATEYLLARPVRSVLDVGCGEAPWRAVLRRMRPGLRYQGVDSSEYVVERHGRQRNIRRGSLGELSYMGFNGPFDLVVCADVIHYVPTSELRVGLASIAKLTRGMAFIEAFTSTDAIEGDHAELQKRTTADYRKLFFEAGLIPLTLHLYTTRQRFAELSALEKGGAGIA